MSDEKTDFYERKSEGADDRRRNRFTNPTPYSGLGKLPPQAIDLEEAVLGGIMMEKDAFLSVSDILTTVVFYKDSHQRIFSAIAGLFANAKPIDILTVTQALRNAGELEMIGGAYYITELTNRVASAANIEFHARIVYQKFIQREMIRISTGVIQSAYEDTTDVFELINNSQSEVVNLLSVTHGRDIQEISALIDESVIEMDMPVVNGLTGVGTGFNSINNYNGGWQPGELTILAARPAMGKAQPLNSKVLTPNGFVEIGNLKIGDVICNSSGGTQKVTGVFPQGIKQTYTVKFNDGTETRCCDEHLWLTHDRYERKNHLEPSVKTLYTIRNSLVTGSDGRKNHSIDFVDPVFFSKRKLLIEPYLLGVLLGDGCLTHLSISNPEIDIIERITPLLPKGCALRKKSHNKCPEYRIIKTGTGVNNPLQDMLKKLGLANLNSHEKIVPPEYLRTSFYDRMELLRGLLDTDGYVVGRHCIEFCTTSPYMKTAMVDLVRSLGGRITYKLKKGKYLKEGVHVECKNYYRMNLSFTSEFIPVTSKKHQERYKYGKNNLQKFITNVVSDKEAECVCISVSDPDHLYITDDYILTHNTALAVQWARNAAVDHNVPTAVFSLEMSAKQLTRRLIASETEIFLEKINKRTLNQYDKGVLKERLTKLHACSLSIDDSAAITISEFRAKCIRLKRQKNIGLVIIDYLQLMHGDKAKIGFNREQEISNISRGLKQVAKELDIPVIALSQLSRALESRAGAAKRPQLSDLRESGSIEQDADNVYFLYRPAYYGLTTDAAGESILQLAELICAKHRNGAPDVIPLKFNGHLTQFEEWVPTAAASKEPELFTPPTSEPDADDLPF